MADSTREQADQQQEHKTPEDPTEVASTVTASNASPDEEATAAGRHDHEGTDGPQEEPVHRDSADDEEGESDKSNASSPPQGPPADGPPPAGGEIPSGDDNQEPTENAVPSDDEEPEKPEGGDRGEEASHESKSSDEFDPAARPPDSNDEELNMGELPDTPNDKEIVPTDRKPEDQIWFWVKKTSTEPIAKEDWKKILRGEYAASPLKFEGDLDGAAACLTAFEEGVKYVHDTFKSKGVEVELPGIVMLAREGWHGYAVVDMYARSLYVNARALAHTSRLDADRSMEGRNLQGELSFVGTPSDLYRLLGVEEAHHDVYNQLRGPTPGFDLSANLVEYDAYEREWQALRWQSRAARERGMRAETQELLQNRLQAAKVLRRLHRHENTINGRDEA